jgi:hypothetical protein
MGTIRTVVAIVSALGVFDLAALQAQRAKDPVPPSRVAVTGTTDVKAVFSFDRTAVSRVDPEHSTIVRLSPGRYRARAASEVGAAYWEQLLDVRPDTPLTVRIALATAVKRRAAEDDVLALLKNQRDNNSRAIQAVRDDAGASRTRASAARAAAPLQTAAALQKVEATIKTISSLERLADSYTRAAGQLATDAGNLSSQANAQNRDTPVGALAGLIGTIGANKLETDAWRNRMRARGALRRMNRLTGALSEASDKGFNYLPDPAQMSATFSTINKGTSGHLKVEDGRLEYSETEVSAGRAATAKGFDVSCTDIRSVGMRGKNVNIRVEGQNVAVSPIGITPEDLLAEIFIACPARNF